MGRKKKMPYSFKSEFQIEVEDTPYHSKLNGIQDLKHRTNIGGVYFKVEHRHEEMLIVTSRSNNLKYAVMDYNFLKHALKQRYGKISNIEIYGKMPGRGKDKWIPLTSDNVFLYKWEELKESFK